MIRRRVPDRSKARSMVQAAGTDMRFLDSLPVGRASAQTLIRSVYEDFRMLGDALLVSEGKEAAGQDHHYEMIDALVKLRIATPRPLLLLHELRKLRHRINYEGYIASEAELRDVVSIKRALWKPLLAEVRRLIEI